MVKVTIGLDAPDSSLTGYGAGAVIQLQRAADEAFSAPIDVVEIPIVAGTYVYETWDSSGTTASWYRWRLENSADSTLGAWSAAFQGIDPAIAARQSGSYASIDDLLVGLPTRPTTVQSDRVLRMERALVKTREMIDLELGFDFFRHPASGSETWIVDAPGGDLLHVHGGIVALDQVEVRDSLTGSWEVVDASDWLLDPDVVPVGQPHFHVHLTGAVSRGSWPRGSRLIRLTGARGWGAPPALAREGNVDWARMHLAADPAFTGGVVGPPQLGQPTGTPPRRMPDSVYTLKRWHVEQFMGCSL